MEWLIVVIVVIALVALVALGALAMTQTRSASLKRRFGPEYDRLVAEEGDRRSGEARLRERAKRHDALDLRELEPDTAADYAQRWREVQLRFVDDPATSLAEADALVEEVALKRGYPVDQRDEGIEMMAVDHPRVVERYRGARAVHHRSTEETVTLDDLRGAFQSYRSLFDELVGVEDPRRRMASPMRAEGESP